jgi:hypothetical protein
MVSGAGRLRTSIRSGFVTLPITGQTGRFIGGCILAGFGLYAGTATATTIPAGGITDFSKVAFADVRDASFAGSLAEVDHANAAEVTPVNGSATVGGLTSDTAVADEAPSIAGPIVHDVSGTLLRTEDLWTLSSGVSGARPEARVSDERDGATRPLATVEDLQIVVPALAGGGFLLVALVHNRRRAARRRQHRPYKFDGSR